MILVDMLLVLAFLFFLFLPITDRKTVQMKICILCALVSVFLVSVTWIPDPGMRLAGVVSMR
jgi:hypothetical protein